MSEIAKHALDQMQLMNEQFYNGLAAGKKISSLAAGALKVAYASALEDEAVKIPTALHFAIENILRLHEEQQVNDYATAAIKRDKVHPQWERDARTGARDEAVSR